jgi:hypothetical protein
MQLKQRITAVIVTVSRKTCVRALNESFGRIHISININGEQVVKY